MVVVITIMVTITATLVCIVAIVATLIAVIISATIVAINSYYDKFIYRQSQQSFTPRVQHCATTNAIVIVATATAYFDILIYDWWLQWGFHYHLVVVVITMMFIANLIKAVFVIPQAHTKVSLVANLNLVFRCIQWMFIVVIIASFDI